MNKFKSILKIVSIVIDALNFVINQIEKQNPLTEIKQDDKPQGK